jgi:hypothetical protein
MSNYIPYQMDERLNEHHLMTVDARPRRAWGGSSGSRRRRQRWFQARRCWQRSSSRSPPASSWRPRPSTTPRSQLTSKQGFAT